MAKVTAYPRLHFGLFDLGHATPRQYGGVGAALNGPPTVVTAEPSASTDLHGLHLLDDGAVADVRSAIERLTSTHPVPPARITIQSIPRQHVGLGTKTTLVLATLTALAARASLTLGESELQRLSGRGGTSGIGVHAFFHGGLLVDGGHRVDEARVFRPSSSHQPRRIPPRILQLTLPPSWSVTLLLARGVSRAQADEIAFFDAVTPLPQAEIHETISLAMMGLAAGAAVADLDAFGAALARMQCIGFKAREIGAQPTAVGALLAELGSGGFAAGMSSMGPLVFVVTEDTNTIGREEIYAIALHHGAESLGTVSFRNSGFELS